MKTLQDFLNNYSSNPELAKKTLKAGGLTWNEIKKMRNDVSVANTGAVPGMIYYNDTVKFVKRNCFLILNALHAFEKGCGLIENKPTEDETKYFNWLAWFAWKYTMNEVLNYLEEN